MNQILITKKLYITPELKRKKKMYKANFILSLFFLIILVSIYVYAAYDRDKVAASSQDILANAKENQDATVADSNILIAVLNDTNDTGEEVPIVSPKLTDNSDKTKQKSASGYTYTVDGTITIPKLGVEYGILNGKTDSEAETEELLKMSPVKFHGPDINTAGNYCIVGHNYRNKKFFSKVPTLVNGDIIEITGADGTMIKYQIYNKYTVDPTDVSCTSQNTNGQKEITLITCTDDSKQRVIVKAKAI